MPSINSFIKSSFFPSCFKFADLTILHKKGRKDAKQNYMLVSILPSLSTQNFMKEACLNKCFPLSKIYFLNTSVVSEKGLVRGNAF